MRLLYQLQCKKDLHESNFSILHASPAHNFTKNMDA